VIVRGLVTGYQHLVASQRAEAAHVMKNSLLQHVDRAMLQLEIILYSTAIMADVTSVG
jgi:hypothetical protein